jgi:hypothetical protein
MSNARGLKVVEERGSIQLLRLDGAESLRNAKTSDQFKELLL